VSSEITLKKKKEKEKQGENKEREREEKRKKREERKISTHTERMIEFDAQSGIFQHEFFEH
jgi:hypothetical protein